MDGVIECMPHLIAATTSIVKILNVHFNRENVREFIVTRLSFGNENIL